MLPELPAHAKGGGNGGLIAQGLADELHPLRSVCVKAFG
jgi:hypothetical protein